MKWYKYDLMTSQVPHSPLEKMNRDLQIWRSDQKITESAYLLTWLTSDLCQISCSDSAFTGLTGLTSSQFCTGPPVCGDRSGPVRSGTMKESSLYAASEAKLLTDSFLSFSFFFAVLQYLFRLFWFVSKYFFSVSWSLKWFQSSLLCPLDGAVEFEGRDTFSMNLDYLVWFPLYCSTTEPSTLHAVLQYYIRILTGSFLWSSFSGSSFELCITSVLEFSLLPWKRRCTTFPLVLWSRWIVFLMLLEHNYNKIYNY